MQKRIAKSQTSLVYHPALPPRNPTSTQFYGTQMRAKYRGSMVRYRFQSSISAVQVAPLHRIHLFFQSLTFSQVDFMVTMLVSLNADPRDSSSPGKSILHYLFKRLNRDTLIL